MKPKVIICGIVFLREEKEPYVRSGRSLHGAQEYDSEHGTIRCHECGEWFEKLGCHVSRTHGMSRGEYRTKHGLWSRARMVSPEASRKLQSGARNSLRANEKRGFTPEQRARARASSWTSEARLVREAANAARRNLVARCPAQLVSRIKSIAADLGRTPTKKEFDAAGLHNLVRAAKQQGVTTAELLEAAGLEPRKRGGQGQNRIADGVLIEILRDFWVLNGRLPGRMDWQSGILPSSSCYSRAFGSLPAAYKAAGLANVSKGKAAA